MDMLNVLELHRNHPNFMVVPSIRRHQLTTNWCQVKAGRGNGFISLIVRGWKWLKTSVITQLQRLTCICEMKPFWEGLLETSWDRKHYVLTCKNKTVPFQIQILNQTMNSQLYGGSRRRKKLGRGGEGGSFIFRPALGWSITSNLFLSRRKYILVGEGPSRWRECHH